MSVLDTRWSLTVEATFSASHQVPGSERCYRDHGHRWRAWTTLTSSEMEKEGIPRGAEGLERFWGDLCAELDYRPLEKMLTGVITTPLGLANYLFERVSAEFPGIVSVRVDDGDGSCGEKSRG